MSLETSKILFRNSNINLEVVVPSSFPFSNRVYPVCPDFSSLSRFDFVLTLNDFKFDTRVNYVIVNHIVPLKKITTQK